MYRDKTRRKQQPKLHAVATGTDGAAPALSTAHEPTELDIRRAGLGIL
jgi:hypothetical protein